jgi:type IX secretion system PorP/SprF family membrane protein
MKNTLSLALMIASIPMSFAQQEPEADMYWNRMVHYNPASIGLNEKTAVNIHGRNQWVSLDDHPVIISFNAAQKIEAIHGAVGVSFEHNQIGFSNMQTALINYAFHIPIKECVLSIGASAGIGRYHTKGNWSSPQTISSETTDYNFHSDAGIVFHHSKFNIGVALTQFNRAKYAGNNSIFYNDVIHYNAFADYTFKLGEQVSLKPQCMVMTDAVKMNVNAALMAIINDKIWFGGSYSNENTFGAFAGYDFFNRFRVGYGVSYFSLSNFSAYTHEAVLSFLLKN